ncbi:MAG: 23S rRNA (pseudouridine(1915)-N(3))-methyltransferase RlmH [candidate division Zixibacteria bacterium]|nr:23S rRNA (pseudouridine(1915)-N(3))-methyltransferase RlmH [candidate division Zixibacteria bacterium]
MIKLKFIFVGKTKESWIAEGIEHYEKMLSKFAELGFITVKDEKVTEHSSEKTVLEKEGERVLKYLDKKSFPFVLDSKGKMLSTEELAELFREKMNQGDNDFIFVTGSALGLSSEVIKSADFKLSLSRMTFPHQLVRLILLEQVYRAFSIIGGRKYHK